MIKERSSHYIVVGQLQFELRGGAEPSEEHVLQVDEGRPEGAVVEGGHQGPGEHVRRAAQEGGEYVERVECGGEVPLAGGVPDGNAVHNVPDQSVVNVGGDHFVVFVWNVDHHWEEMWGLQGRPELFRVDKNIVINFEYKLGIGTAGREPLEEKGRLECEIEISVVEILQDNVIIVLRLCGDSFLQVRVS